MLPCGVFSDKEISSKKRWIQVVVNQVWSRWLKEFLPALIERKKGKLPSHNLSVGDLVLVVNEKKTQRGDLPLPRVTRIFPGKDDTICVCEVMTKCGVYKTPVAKLDDFRSGCRNVSHQQQFFSELHSPGRSHNTNY